MKIDWLWLFFLKILFFEMKNMMIVKVKVLNSVLKEGKYKL